MHQKDFSKIKSMNVHSDIVYANQTDETSYCEHRFEGHTAKMISTQTRGVGVNRNLALTYATGKYCLFADDDIIYRDDLEKTVVSEFEAHPDADVFIFHLETDDPNRPQRQYAKTRRVLPWDRMPWGGFRVAIRLSSVQKANLWFTTLFGGGCIFPSGEDSLWLIEAKRKGLRFYVSDKTIGFISFADSSWFTGYDAKYFYGRGALCRAAHPIMYPFWNLYFSVRVKGDKKLSRKDKMTLMKAGNKGYLTLTGFSEYEKVSKDNEQCRTKKQSDM